MAHRRPAAPAAHDVKTLALALQTRLHGLVLCFSRSWGGLEQIAANDCIEAARLDLDLRVMCLEGTPFHEFMAKAAETLPTLRLIPIASVPRNFMDLELRRHLKDLVDRQGVNLIHFHQPNVIGSIVPWVWPNRNLVIIASRHIMNAHNKRNPFHTLLYQRLDAFVVMSESLKENVLRTHPLKEKQLKVIHYGLDFQKFDPRTFDNLGQRREWGADEETVVIGVVGRIDRMKGQDVFLKAVAGLLKGTSEDPPRKYKFVVVGDETRGSSDGYLDELKALAKSLHLDNHVLFTGYTDNVPRVMSALDIFVMPSRQEAFGMVAIEAMAMKTPIIISRGGSADEIVGPAEDYGLLARPFDAFDLQAKLRFLLDQPEMRQRMAERGCEYVRRHYDRELRLQNTLDLYERLLRRRGV